MRYLHHLLLHPKIQWHNVHSGCTQWQFSPLERLADVVEECFINRTGHLNWVHNSRHRVLTFMAMQSHLVTWGGSCTLHAMAKPDWKWFASSSHCIVPHMNQNGWSNLQWYHRNTIKIIYCCLAAVLVMIGIGSIECLWSLMTWNPSISRPCPWIRDVHHRNAICFIITRGIWHKSTGISSSGIEFDDGAAPSLEIKFRDGHEISWSLTHSGWGLCCRIMIDPQILSHLNGISSSAPMGRWWAAPSLRNQFTFQKSHSDVAPGPLDGMFASACVEWNSPDRQDPGGRNVAPNVAS